MDYLVLSVMDAMLLLVAFMRKQNFGDVAGVDPDAWHQQFDLIESDEDGDLSEPIMPVPGTNGVMVNSQGTILRYQYHCLHAEGPGY